MVGLLIVAISTLLSIVSGITVLSINWKRTANITYGITSLSYIFLGIINFLSTVASGQQKLIFARLVMVFTCISIVLTYYLVVALLPLQVHQRRKLLMGIIPKVLAAGLTAVIVCLSLTPLVIKSVNGESLQFNWAILLFAGHLTFFATVALQRMVYTAFARRIDLQTRTQATYLIIGFIPIVFLAPITGIYLPAVLHNLHFIALTPAYSGFFVASISYAMIRYRLFDIRPYVVRAISYVTTVLLLGVIYIAPTIYLLGIVIMGFKFDWYKFIVASIVGTIIALNFARARVIFDQQTARLFFRDSYDAGALLGTLNRRLVSSIDVNELLMSSTELICETLKAEYCAFVLLGSDRVKPRIIGDTKRTLSIADIHSLSLYTNRSADNVMLTEAITNTLPPHLHKTLVKDDIAVMVSLGSKRRMAPTLGMIVLGYKRSGNAYTKQDVRTMESVADVMAIAIQNALHFEEIQNFNAMLQEKVAQATRELRRTNEKLKRLDETKDDFISMASHQLRTPLTSVKGYVSLVLDGDAGPIKPQQRELLNQAFASSQRMVYLISDLLNLSRLKTGKFVIDAHPTNLSDLITDELSQLEAAAASRSIKLQYDKPAHFPTLLFDETKIRQVIMNFVDNALYYTPANGEVRVELLDRPSTIELRVIDNGIGVPKAEQRHLFTKFYRAGNARQARPDGTGLGLYMAKKVIVAQGGSVLFDSVEGKGSTFGFSFAKKPLEPPVPASL